MQKTVKTLNNATVTNFVLHKFQCAYQFVNNFTLLWFKFLSTSNWLYPHCIQIQVAHCVKPLPCMMVSVRCTSTRCIGTGRRAKIMHLHFTLLHSTFSAFCLVRQFTIQISNTYFWNFRTFYWYGGLVGGDTDIERTKIKPIKICHECENSI
jgi:hypothetical protein